MMFIDDSSQSAKRLIGFHRTRECSRYIRFQYDYSTPGNITRGVLVRRKATEIVLGKNLGGFGLL